MTGNSRRVRFKSSLTNYLFVLPAIIFLVTFIVYPVLYNIILSICKIDLTFFAKREYNFIGLKNYVDLFKASDRLLITSILNTTVFTVISIPFLVVLSFCAALFLQRNSRINRLSRTLMLIGYILPQTVTAMTFRLMFLKDGGVINYFLHSLRLVDAPVGFLIDKNVAMSVIIVTNVWISFPFSMLLFTAGLGTLDQQIVEAGMIDGAGWWKRLIYIIIPSLRNTITIVLTLGVINTFKVFDLVYILTGGGPGNATQMLSTYAYKLSFALLKYDYGAVTTNVLLIILLLVGSVYIHTVRKEDD